MRVTRDEPGGAHGNRAGRPCSSCSQRGGHSSWCPRRGLDYDPNPRMSDDEVRAMGLVKDDRGVWHRPTRLDPTRSRRERVRRCGEARCLTCGVPDDRHYVWCWRGDELESSVGAATRDARDLQSAIQWQPPERDPELNPELSPPEREQLARLFDALVARRREEEREQEPPPRKLWSIREWRDHVARKREGVA
jgi:hypothetical protein